MVKPKNKHSLSHVRHDPAHCLAPGLFRALKRGERKRSKLDVTYDYGDGKRIEFSGPEPLGADDLRILQGLVAMAGPNGLVLGPEPKTEGGRQLRLFLEPKWEAVTADAMVVKGSYRALAKEIGAEVDSGGRSSTYRTASSAFGRYPSSPRMAASGRGFGCCRSTPATRRTGACTWP